MLDRLENISLLDDDQIGLLREALDPDELAAMLSDLPVTAGQALEAIERAAEAEDLAEVRRAAHALKGAASSFGAAGLTEVARWMELEMSSMADVDRAIPFLIETIARTTAALPIETRKLA